ncbi:hypothetical protein J6590_007310 [Homalodisca vitripennis]|nr:hypothetical protein J6590_007304 [Homalodisca vitripennis]KAG8298725.1 hypothetical protein J6590_007310 [Homalodisca vitripennis]
MSHAERTMDAARQWTVTLQEIEMLQYPANQLVRHTILSCYLYPDKQHSRPIT